MKDIRAIRGKFYIRRLIEEGEHEQQDFKYAISDARKIARSISAFSNNRGGRLLVGVKDNGVVVGIPNEEDIYMIEHAARRYCRPEVEVGITAYLADNNAVVLKIDIPQASFRPVFCLEENDRPVAYYRVADENIAAHPLMVRAWEMSAAGADMTLDGRLMGVLSWIKENQPVSPDNIHFLLHLSKRLSDSMLIKLAALGLIEFSHTSRGFEITIP